MTSKNKPKAKKKKKPFVSLVLCSRNEERNVKMFFDSLKKQTVKPDEVILVDASNDRTAELAKPHVDQLHKVKPVSAAYQRDIGIGKSKGDIIVFTDVDAELFPDWLEQLLKMFERPEVHVVVGYIKTIKAKEVTDLAPPKTGRLYMHHCNAAYRRHVLEEFKFDPEIYFDDVDLGWRVGKKYVIYGCPEAKVLHHRENKTPPSFSREDFLRHGLAYAKFFRKYKWDLPFWFARWLYNLFHNLFIRRKPKWAWYWITGLIYGLKVEFFGAREKKVYDGEKA